MRQMLALTTAAALLAAAVSTVGAATTRPYVGAWKAKVGADLLLDNGIAQPAFRGVWRLKLKPNGTYRAYNPWDKWLEGSYSANATRIVFSKDKGCLAAGFKSPGVYRWKLTKGKLDLTSVAVGSDPCGGRWQTLSIPVWTKA